MNLLALFIWTLHDIIEAAITVLIILAIGGYIGYAFFVDWKNSPKRWWNRK